MYPWFRGRRSKVSMAFATLGLVIFRSASITGGSSVGVLPVPTVRGSIVRSGSAWAAMSDGPGAGGAPSGPRVDAHRGDRAEDSHLTRVWYLLHRVRHNRSPGSGAEETLPAWVPPAARGQSRPDQIAEAAFGGPRAQRRGHGA